MVRKITVGKTEERRKDSGVERKLINGGRERRKELRRELMNVRLKRREARSEFSTQFLFLETSYIHEYVAI